MDSEGGKRRGGLTFKTMKWIFLFVLLPYFGFSQHYEVEYTFTNPNLSDSERSGGYILIGDDTFIISDEEQSVKLDILSRSVDITEAGTPFTQFVLRGMLVRRAMVERGYLFYLYNIETEQGLYIYTREVR